MSPQICTCESVVRQPNVLVRLAFHFDLPKIRWFRAGLSNPVPGDLLYLPVGFNFNPILTSSSRRSKVVE